MRRYRIGLMAVHSSIDYPHSLRMGVQNTIEEAGHTLVTIAEQIPYHTLTNAEANLRVACEIAERLELDTIIFPVGCTTAYLQGDNDKALELLQTMDPARTLVLEREIPGYRCIGKDNAPGMHECMRHLLDKRGFTKIAFVSGPANSKGAQEREAIYFEEMRAHGIEPNPSLFARGFFSGDCADVVEKLLDENPDLEAIACACDLIAYTTYSVLHRRGLNPGKDIAVTGFDDNPRSAHMDPPLSTVHMTSYDFGCMAAREALRMCEGLPQEERMLSSTFIARGSCGENVRNNVEYFRELLRQQPFPFDTFVGIMLDSTLSMAGPRITRDFRRQMESFLSTVRDAVIRHRTDPGDDDLLFSSQDLAALFGQAYRKYLSLEGFHTVAITLLEALLEESPQEDMMWVIEQISHLHLRVARLLSTAQQTDMINANKREWITFHTIDDALREDHNPVKAYELILGEFQRMGVHEADLFLLPDPVEFVSGGVFALSDKLRHIGGIEHGAVEVNYDVTPIVFQEVLSCVLHKYGDATECVVGGVMAGNELMGIACVDNDILSDHDQLMAFLNLGSAFKHLQMIASERETNEILNQNNLLLARQSERDEMTGLLNRRGFMNRVAHLASKSEGEEAAILFLDLDGLKTINDTYGHDTGDEAIKATAKILSACIPQGGVLSRLGGDEFVAYVTIEEADDIEQILAIVQIGMAEYNDTHDVPYQLSISSGASVFAVNEGTVSAIPELMNQADERLYEMKRKRKDSRRYQG